MFFVVFLLFLVHLLWSPTENTCSQTDLFCIAPMVVRLMVLNVIISSTTKGTFTLRETQQTLRRTRDASYACFTTLLDKHVLLSMPEKKPVTNISISKYFFPATIHYAMKHERNGDLHVYMSSGVSRLDSREMMHVIAGVGKGLQFLHAKWVETLLGWTSLLLHMIISS